MIIMIIIVYNLCIAVSINTHSFSIVAARPQGAGLARDFAARGFFDLSAAKIEDGGVLRSSDPEDRRTPPLHLRRTPTHLRRSRISPPLSSVPIFCAQFCCCCSTPQAPHEAQYYTTLCYYLIKHSLNISLSLYIYIYIYTHTYIAA